MDDEDDEADEADDDECWVVVVEESDLFFFDEVDVDVVVEDVDDLVETKAGSPFLFVVFAACTSDKSIEQSTMGIKYLT